MTIKESIEKYLDHVNRYRSKGTYLYYRKSFKLIESSLYELGYYDLDDIDDLIFEELTDFLLKVTNKKNSKINDTISCLITLLNFFEVQHPKRYKLKDDTDNFKALTNQEVIILFKYLNNLDLKESNNLSWVLAIYLFLETGVRLSELLDISTRNINTEYRTILLDHTKNGYKRYVFYDDLSDTLIKKRLKMHKEKLIWNDLQNCPMTEISLRHFIDKLNKQLQFKENMHPHKLRKTFATQLLRNGCPITTISKLLGHRDIRQTMIYLQIDEMMLLEDYQKFYPYKKRD